MSTTLSKTHTPGPWHTVADNTQVNANGIFVARVHWGLETEANADANARLIAAAPELLEALEAVDEQFANLSQRDWLDQVRAAIRKAKGKQ